MGAAARLRFSKIVRRLSDLFSPRTEMLKDAAFLGWGPVEPVAYEDYLKHLSSLPRRIDRR
jgi:hypothetical protein